MKLEEDFKDIFITLVEKYYIKDVDNFKNDLLSLIDTLKINDNNNISEFQDNFFKIIENYSNIDFVINEAKKERMLWQKK